MFLKVIKNFKKIKYKNNTWITTTWGLITSIKTEYRQYHTAQRYSWARMSNAWPGVLKLHSTFSVIRGQHVQPTKSAHHIFVLTMSRTTDGMFVTFCRLEQNGDKTYKKMVFTWCKSELGISGYCSLKERRICQKQLAFSTPFKLV